MALVNHAAEDPLPMDRSVEWDGGHGVMGWVGVDRDPLRRDWPMVEAAYTPLVVLLVVVLVAGSLRVGVFVALCVETLVLGGLGFFATRRSGGSRPDAVTWSLVSAGLGIVVILLKLLLH